MLKRFRLFEPGFTLLELLIVLGIISLLLTISGTVYTAAQKRSRDTKRKTDLEEIRTAIELYRSNNNLYPTSDVDCQPDPNGIRDVGDNIYLSKIPTDPRCPTYTYYYTSTGSDYTIGAYLEQGGTSSCGLNCFQGQVCNYCLGPYGQK